MGKFYEDLKEGLEDVIAHRKGKLHLRSETTEVPEPPAQYVDKGIYPTNNLAKRR